MLAREGVALLREAETRLLLRPAGQHSRPQALYRYRIRHVAPRAAHRVVPALKYPQERIVAAGQYLAVVQQKAVRQATQLLQRLGVFIYNRCVGEVRARHHKTVEIVPEQQHVQRRVREHHAQCIVLAQMHQLSARALIQQHDGPAEGRKRPGLGLGYLAEPPRTVEVAAHHREGLLVPVLAPPQLAHGLLILREAGKVHAAQALHAEDAAALYQPPRRLYAVARQPAALRIHKKGPRSADRAAVRLCVIPPVFNVRKLRRTVRAHRELRHGGEGPVVGHGADYGKPGTAVRTVYEGIPVPAVRGVEQLAQAVLADADVGRDERAHGLSPVAADYPEPLIAARSGQLAAFHRFYHGKRRGLVPQLSEKPAKLRLLALELQLGSPGAVAHPACQLMPPYQPVNEGPKAHTLHNTPDFYAKPCQFSPNNVKYFMYFVAKHTLPHAILPSALLFVNKLTSCRLLLFRPKCVNIVQNL